MNNQWMVSTKDTEVTYIWWLDTVAILDDYSEEHVGILPKGELVKVSEDSTCEGKVVLDLKNHRSLENTQLPKGRKKSRRFLSPTTPLQAIVTHQQYELDFETENKYNKAVDGTTES